MLLDKILISLTAFALGVSGIGAGAANTAVLNKNEQTLRAEARMSLTTVKGPESGRKYYYAYPTDAVEKMSSVKIGAKVYSMPLTMEKLAADGWIKPDSAAGEDAKSAVGKNTKSAVGKNTESDVGKNTESPQAEVQAFVAACGDLQLSLEENAGGGIEKLVEIYNSPGVVVLPGGISAGISEEKLVSSLESLPLPFDSSHYKNETSKYHIVVPLKPEQGYPACEYTVMTDSGRVSGIEIRMIPMDEGKEWPGEVLAYRALTCFEAATGETPPFFRIEEQQDGTLQVRLFEDMEDHVATWALYCIDRSGKGYDVISDPNGENIIDFMSEPVAVSEAGN